ncbi:MAG: 2-hydroxyacid dehydrogenase [Geminicoccaceae bacterium]
MTRPEVVELIDVHPGTTARLDRDYVLHRLWEGDDRDRLIGDVAPRVRAAVTNGIVGMKGDLIEALPALEIIGVFGVGVDAVDRATARARGVRVTNTPEVLTEGVAELALALLLAVARRIPFNDRFVRAGRWPKEGDPALASSLAGRRLGIVGLGRIGRRVAQLAAAFGMEICYGGPRRKDDVAWRYYDDLVAMARAVDCLMLTCKGGPETAGLIGREVIEAVGPDGWLINVSRGSVVDEPALVEALVGGRLGAAGLDVFAREPRVPEALLGLDNVVLQPHQGSASEETRAAMGRLVLDNLEAHFAGRPLLTPVA